MTELDIQLDENGKISKDDIVMYAGLYNNGLISVLDVETAIKISNSWEWRFKKMFVPIISTAFGDLFLFCLANGKIYFFQPQYNTSDLVTDNIRELFDKALVHPSIKSGLLQENKFKEIYSTHLHLKYGETYILKPWEMFGGKVEVNNYTKGGLYVYQTLVSQTIEKKHSQE